MKRDGSSLQRLSISTTETMNKDRLPWTLDPKARDVLFAAFTCFYALLVVLVGLMLELSHLLLPGDERAVDKPRDLVFAVISYGGSLVYLTHSTWSFIQQRWSCLSSLSSSKQQQQQQQQQKTRAESDQSSVMSNSPQQPSTGSLYLRLGCVVFGVFGTVYYGLIVAVCLIGWHGENSDCNVNTLIISILAGLFIFIQMHFVFCNSKIGVGHWRYRARLGIMHLVATNLWTWMRYVLKEEATTAAEIAKWSLSNHSKNAKDMECHGANCVMGSFSEFMYTCVVEYSLVCAGVALVFWTNIDKERRVLSPLDNRRHHMVTVDCSKTTRGLFVGLGFFICLFISIALFNSYAMEEHSKELANRILHCANGILYLFALLGCLFAFYRLRDLNFVENGQVEDESAELLDRILLVVGLIGELLFSIGNLMAFLLMDGWVWWRTVLFMVQLLRLCQVLAQTALLTLGSKLHAEARQVRRDKPGKQVITFLIMANIGLFILNTFEAQKADDIVDVVSHLGHASWALLIWEHTFSVEAMTPIMRRDSNTHL